MSTYAAWLSDTAYNGIHDIEITDGPRTVDTIIAVKHADGVDTFAAYDKLLTAADDRLDEVGFHRISGWHRINDAGWLAVVDE